jgi:hypothetical protein
MKQPHEFGPVLEGSLSDGQFVFAMLMSHSSYSYDFDPMLIAKVVHGLKSGEPSHAFIHARIKMLLRRDLNFCTRFLQVLPTVFSADMDCVELLGQVYSENPLIYTLLVEALYLDATENGRRSVLSNHCSFHGFERNLGQRTLFTCVLRPFTEGNVQWPYYEAACKLIAAVFNLKGVGSFVDFAASQLDDLSFVRMVRHLPEAGIKLSLLLHHLIVKKRTLARDVDSCARSLKDITLVSHPIDYEFLKTILSTTKDEALKATLLAQNGGLLESDNLGGHVEQ